ncbi:MAG: FHA domain-containing protein [bacterium]
MSKCPNCNREMPKGAIYCPYCVEGAGTITDPVAGGYNIPAQGQYSAPAGTMEYSSYAQAVGGAGGTIPDSDSMDPNKTIIAKKMVSMAWLTITTRRGQGTRFDLSQGRSKIGRSADNDIVLDDETISREHAILAWQDDHYVLLDLMSAAGLFINGIRIGVPTDLKDGDTLLVGETELVFKEIVKDKKPRP